MLLLHELTEYTAKKYGSMDALYDKYSNYSCTYIELHESVKNLASGLKSIGLQRGDHVAQFSENSPRWMITDQGVISCGAANAIRGSMAPLSELEYIYEHSDSIALITDSTSVIKHFISVEDKYNIRFILYIGGEKIDKNDYRCKSSFYTFDEILELGKQIPYTPTECSADDVVTLIYSSGTTGKPKGIMLTHKNFVSQIETITASLKLPERQNVLSVLPIWHAYERTAGYYMLYLGSRVIYTTPKYFKNDLKSSKIVVIVAVPRLWEAVYDGVMQELSNKPKFTSWMMKSLLKASSKYTRAKRLLNNNDIYNETPNVFNKLAASLKVAGIFPIHVFADKLIYSKLKKLIGFDTMHTAISGGGALLPQVGDFYEAIGVPIQIGYGLTETSPILTVTRRENNKIYSAGEPLIGTEILIVDPETYAPLKQGEKGLVLAKGGQIMKGYYKNPEESAKVLLANGYIVTGDLGWLCKDGSLVLVGRLKDIIVLSNGENVEADAIEAACMNSDYVSQIVLTGQDKNALSALVVPNIEAVKQLAHNPNMDINKLNNEKEVKLKILKDLQNKIKNRPNYRCFERLANIHFIGECTVDNGLMTQTIKIKKHVVCERYQFAIDDMYAK